MYFPFVGLALAACWPVALWLYRREPLSRRSRATLAAVCCVVLAVSAVGVRERNRVWHTEESLWRDVTLKSPHNGRGLMNYGLTQMAKGEMKTALDYFERALVFTPNYPTLEVNLGVVNSALNRGAEAEQHFQRAVQLAPADAVSHYFYARWLHQNGRSEDALTHLQVAVAANPDHLAARSLLQQISRPAPKTADDYLNLSLTYYRQGKYRETIAAAQESLRLKPDYAEAYNNIAAAYQSMSEWEPAIAAARHALALKPDFTLARNNLLWSESQLNRKVLVLRASR
jgi:tetratricopeptide (TPR) repeat protein